MNEVKVGKLPITASYTCNYLSKLVQGGKNMVDFGSTVQTSRLYIYIYMYMYVYIVNCV